MPCYLCSFLNGRENAEDNDLCLGAFQCILYVLLINTHISIYKHTQRYVFICYYAKLKLLEFPHHDLLSLSYLHITDK